MLRTWALVELPRAWQTDRLHAVASSNSVNAAELADHRLAYLDYEGPVSGERGTVSRVDAGTFETDAESPDCWELTLNGSLLRGRLALRRISTDDRRWTLTVDSGD